MPTWPQREEEEEGTSGEGSTAAAPSLPAGQIHRFSVWMLLLYLQKIQQKNTRNFLEKVSTREKKRYGVLKHSQAPAADELLLHFLILEKSAAQTNSGLFIPNTAFKCDSFVSALGLSGLCDCCWTLLNSAILLFWCWKNTNIKINPIILSQYGATAATW